MRLRHLCGSHTVGDGGAAHRRHGADAHLPAAHAGSAERSGRLQKLRQRKQSSIKSISL